MEQIMDKTTTNIDHLKFINQSVAFWCFDHFSLAQLCQIANELGIKSIELLGIEGQDKLREKWDMLISYGLIDAMNYCHSFEKGLNNPKNHKECLEKLGIGIEACAEYKFPNVVTFAGLRVPGMSDTECIENCVTALKSIMPLAEKKGVNVCLEMLNSRVDKEMKGHPGYWDDDIDRTVEIIRLVDSPRMKLLFDIYHVQVMHGDIIRRIQQYKDYIAHYHTAGNPGRGDIGSKQEINYPAIMRIILETGFKGFVCHEFDPETNAFQALKQAVSICTV